jgi:lysophospholipase
MIETITPDGLENLCLPPEKWQWGWLSRSGYQLRYGWAAALEQSNKTVVILHGLSEFSEKYFETASEILASGYNVMTLDWRGQGASSRYLENPHKRHSQGFANDAQDLLDVIANCPVTNAGQDLYLLSHSMGGNIGFHALLEKPDLFRKAAFSAPLLGLRIFESVPEPFSTALLSVLCKTGPDNYAPLGGDWNAGIREIQSLRIFSTDPKRGCIHNAWMLQNPPLQVGHVTLQWLFDAHQACKNLSRAMKEGRIKLPCLIASSGHEHFVSNTAIKKAARILPDVQRIHYPEARHEILMENDIIRKDFLQRVFTLFED